jgi:hypothetical protein
MALYVSVARFRRAGLDAKDVRKEAQELVDYFTAWTPPNGVTLLHLWIGVDGTEAIGVWDSDGHAGLSTLGAQFLPWADIEIIPVLEVQESLIAQGAGGLFKTALNT